MKFMQLFHAFVIGIMPVAFFALACLMILQKVYWVGLLLLATCVVFWLILAGDKMRKNGSL